MKNGKLFILLMLAGGPLVLAQNLVPNPNFSEFSNCPSGMGQIHLATPWRSPNQGGVEFMHRCAGTGPAGVPVNERGAQEPFVGNGYAGVRTWREGGLYREYLAVELISSLEQGVKYQISFFVSPGDSMSYISDDIGLALSRDPIPNQELLNMEPVIENEQGDFINQLNNWRRISGEFVALGGEKYLVIGNFKDEAETTRNQRSNATELHPSVYYFVDNVVVEPCQTQLPTSLISPSDTTLCEGQSLVLSGHTDATVDLLYEWSTGSTDPSIEIEEPGEYQLNITVGGCTQSDTILVGLAPAPVVDLGPDQEICPGEAIQLTVDDPGSTIRWSDGSTAPTLEVSLAGRYIAEVRKGACVKNDTIRITLAEERALPDWDSLVCEGETIFLKAEIEGLSYRWSDGNTDPVRPAEAPGVFWVEIESRCFVEQRYFDLRTLDCGCEVFMPNVFTPNDDGIHDRFTPQLKEGVQDFELRIFDRWGREMYHTEQPYLTWEGNYKGKRVQEGVYFWVMDYQCFEQGAYVRSIQKGSVTLLR